MTNEEIYDFWVYAKKVSPTITLKEAAALVRKLLADKRKAARKVH